MSYGITKESQIIDKNTIKAGCESLKTILSDFEECGDCILNAGNIMDEKALSIDDKTFKETIIDLGNQIKKIKSTYSGYADDVINQASKIYSAQVTELDKYREEQEK